jgi:type IV pilus assembly protein PilX
MKLPNNIMNQKGTVLVVGLIFLLVLTIIGITSMSSSALTEKMTQNMRDVSQSFSSAEACLTDGETWVQNQTVTPTPVSACSTPPCQVWQYNVLGTFYTQPASWWQSQGVSFSTSLYGVANQPRYILEQYSFVPYDLSPDTASKGRGYYFYRITARGTGATTNANSIVQSIYATQFN